MSSAKHIMDVPCVFTSCCILSANMASLRWFMGLPWITGSNATFINSWDFLCNCVIFYNLRGCFLVHFRAYLLACSAVGSDPCPGQFSKISGMDGIHLGKLVPFVFCMSSPVVLFFLPPQVFQPPAFFCFFSRNRSEDSCLLKIYQV